MGWSDLVKNGCSWTHVLTISGIPYIFTESSTPRANDAGLPGVPSGYLAAVPALLIKKGQRVGCSVDRSAGFASGDAFTVTLSWDGLDGAGVTDDLFQTPTVITKLVADIDETTGNKLFDAATAAPWSASFGYIGTERVGISTTGVDGTLNFTSRGTVGSQAGIYTHRSPTFSLLSDRPRVWRGRDVTLWRCLTTAEGLIIDSTWLQTASTTSRVIWRGYIDSPPRPVADGMTLRCLSIARRAALPLGHSVGAGVYQACGSDGAVTEAHVDAINNLPVYWAPGSELFSFNWKSGAGGGLTVNATVRLSKDHPDGVMTLGQLGTYVYSLTFSGSGASVNMVENSMWDAIGTATAVAQGHAADPELSDIIPLGSKIIVDSYGNAWMRFRFGTHVNACTYSKSYIKVPSGGGRPSIFGSGHFSFTEFTETLHQHGGYTMQDGGAEVMIPLFGLTGSYVQAGWWLPIVQTEGTQWQDVTFPSSGHGLIEQGEAKQVVRWDQKIEGAMHNVDHPGLVMLRVAEEVTQPTSSLAVYGGATLSYTTGLRSSVSDAMLTLLQSSGAGNRGAKDTLAVGQGAGMHEDLINELSLLKPGMSLGPLDLLSDGSASIGDLLGGHLALRQLCLVQRTTDPDATEPGASYPGDCQLFVVWANAPLADEGALEISASELVLESIEAPELADAPNTIDVDMSTLMRSGDRTITIQDLPRIQAEGPRSKSYNAPGMPVDMAVGMAASIIAMGDGQMIATMRVAPWVEVQPGDDVRLTIAHPMIYDYGTATRGTALVGARCLGWETDLFDGLQRITLLIGGSTPGLGYLCPSVSVVAKVDSTTLTIGSADAQWLATDDQVLIYNPGEEQNSTPENATYTIDSVSGTTVNLTGAVASWVGAGSIITYPLHASCTTRQQRFTHIITTDRWG